MDEIIKIEYEEITPDRLREQFRKHGYIAVPLSEKRAFLCCELLELNSGLDSKERGGIKVRLRWLGLMLESLLLNIRAAVSHGALLDVVAFWILEKPKKC